MTANNIIEAAKRFGAESPEDRGGCTNCGGTDISDLPRDDGRTDCEPEYLKCDDCNTVMHVI